MRQPWAPEHERHVFWAEKGLAGVLILLGAFMAYWGAGIAQYAGVGIASIGSFMFFPKIRPLISGLIDRIPFLTPKTPDKDKDEDEDV